MDDICVSGGEFAMDNGIQTINSLSRGLEILDLIYEHGKMGVTELGRFLNVNKSTAYRLLRTLEAAGFVEQIGDNGKYELGLKLCKFRDRVLDKYDIRSIAHPFLEELADVTGEAAGLSVWEDDRIYIIDCCTKRQYLGVILKTGDVEEVHCTAHGKALFYALDEDRQLSLLSGRPLEKHTQYTITSCPELMREAKENKARRYAVDDEETTPGMRCIASCIYDYTGSAVASIGISGPVERVTAEAVGSIAEKIIRIADNISKKLGY